MFAALASTLLMTAAGPAAAPVAAPTAAAAPAVAPLAAQARRKAKATDVTCWTEQPAGSRIPMRICATREELEKAERDGQDAVTGEHRSSKGGFTKP